MGYPGLTLPFRRSLSDSKGTFVSFEGSPQLKFHNLLRLLQINLNKFLTNQLYHLNPQFLLFQSTSIIKRILQYLYSLLLFLPLIMTLPQSQQRYQLILFVLNQIDTTLHEIANSMTFW